MRTPNQSLHYSLLSVPESGLFYDREKHNLRTGNGHTINAFRLRLFPTHDYAVTCCDAAIQAWQDGDQNGEFWSFVILPVKVERKQ
jgi:hypothetical protein